MNRYLFAAITFAALLFTFLAEASACNRCGIFGRGCRFASHAPVHHVPHVEKAVVRESAVQNFIFNNIAPTGDLAPRGDTIYGLSRALDYNAPSSALYQDNLRRLIDLGTELTVSSRDLDSNLTRALEIDAKGRAIEAGFRALASDTTSTATAWNCWAAWIPSSTAYADGTGAIAATARRFPPRTIHRSSNRRGHP